jgi:hypothetical protein
MRVVRLPDVRSYSTVAALLLALAACGSPANNSALFTVGGSTFVGAGAGSSQASGGSGSASTGSGGSNSSGASAAGSGGTRLSGDTGGHPNAGGAPGSGGDGGPGSGGGGAPGSGGMDMPMGGGPATGGGGSNGGGFDDCSSLPNNPTYDPDTRHCYLAVHDMMTFADAKSHCSSLGAHLVTLSNGAENDFAWSVDANEHWIGATDGKGLREMMPGTYSWIDGEAFGYTDWSQGQPNASPSTCPETSGGGMCYEHCGFQWSGGAAPGEWNDRLCVHTIDSVCEWDG